MMAANTASLALHHKAGFRDVGIRERYGHLNGVWHDVVLLERRSALAGGEKLPTKTCGPG
jgi:L-amino acid N-acyltransferase YncA